MSSTSSEPAVVLWIGVIPESLTGEQGVVVASACREVLFKYHITNINVEIRESVVTRSVGPALLEPVHRGDPTYSIRESLTPTLGLSISPALNLDIQGTGGFFIRDQRDLSTLFLVTCRHLVLPRNFENDHYASNGIEAEVVLLGNRAYQEFQASVENAVNAHDENVINAKWRIDNAADAARV